MPTKKNTRKLAARRRTVKSTSAKRTSTRTAKPRRSAPEKKALQLRDISPSFTVDDLQKSLAWYTDVLGFRVKERWEHGGQLMGAELEAGNVGFFIGQDDWKKGRDRVKGEGFRLYCTTTQDVDALAARIKERGGELFEPPHDESWGARVLTVKDPDGFKVSISKG
jgi:uncharacterized glyoxalase superfamily protein PhnB